MLKVVDLFAGCGGLTLGLENAGFNVVVGVDNWEPAIRLYQANFQHPMLNIDLLDVDKSVATLKDYTPDVIVGGPPCQDYSSAGKRDEEQGRADLTISFAKIIDSIRPRFFIMENVDRITKSKRYQESLVIFKSAGYGLTKITLDASYCGAPQKRKRHFVIGSLDHKDDFLLETLTRMQAKTPMTIREYLGNSLGIDHYYRHPRNYNRRGIFSIDEPSPTVRGVNRPLPSGYPGHANDSTHHLSGVRPLTTKERSLIQTFPENYQLIGSKSDTEQAIGNAVPVKLAEFVGRCLLDFLEEPALEKKRSFKPNYEAAALPFDFITPTPAGALARK